MTTAIDRDRLLALTLAHRLACDVSTEEARTLRRAALTLHRWAELECGDGNAYASWAIERDGEERTGAPFMVTRTNNHRPGGPSHTTTRTRIPDREKGALARIATLCQSRGWHYYHQTDPRGAALYIAAEPLTDQTCPQGVAV